MQPVSQKKPNRAIIVGGSITGLFIGLCLQRRGWQVDVYERSRTPLHGRSTGIVSQPELLAALAHLDIPPGGAGVSVSRRITLDRRGEIVGDIALPQTFCAWDHVYRLLLQRFSANSYHLGFSFMRADQTEEQVTAHFDDGSRVSADLLIGADGIHSVVRRQIAPEVVPVFAGYVCWRGTADEQHLDAATRALLFPHMAFQFPRGNHIMGFPIAGANDDLRPGHRRYNFIWHRIADEATLTNMLTDATGRVHAFGIPTALLRPELIERMRQDAADILAEPFLRLLEAIRTPFLTPIYDQMSPRMVLGRIALMGDAASVARPQTGYGVTKGACDAMALASILSDGPDDVPAALLRFERERMSFGQDMTRLGRKLATHLVVNTSNSAEIPIAYRCGDTEMMRRIGAPLTA